MMNRPRPRKIVSVIKTSSPMESIEEISFEDKKISKNTANERKFNFESVTNDSKPQSPVVALSSCGTVKPTADNKHATVPKYSQSATPVAPRKPVVATLKKAHFPPPPTFSDSPKSSPASLAKIEKIEFENTFPETAQTSNSCFSSLSENKPQPLSPKSSGETFLDAADKAADFISGAFLNSFKSFNLTDTTPIKMEMDSMTESKIKDEDDPFADIMKKLKSQPTPNSPVVAPQPAKKSEFFNLMDEEPPETFKQFNEPSESPLKSPIKPKLPEASASSFIKAAFSQKHKEEPVKGLEKAKAKESRKEYEVTSKEKSCNFDTELRDIEKPEQVQVLNFTTENIIINSGETENIIKTADESIQDIKYNESIEQNLQDDFKDDEPTIIHESNMNFVHQSNFNGHAREYQVKVEHDVNNKTIYENGFEEDSETILKCSSESQTLFETPPPPLHKDEPLSISPILHYNPIGSMPSNNFDGSVSSSSGPSRAVELVSSTTSSSSSSIPFFDSLSSIISNNNSDSSNISSPTNSSFIKSPSSPQPKTSGFRASILKHGLSALEKIGKSTADVVVSTRNKLAEPSISQFSSGQQVITPDFSDENSSFYDILKLYGGYNKLQELQLKGVKASISMKLARKKGDNNIEKVSSFDYQSRQRIRREISNILHPDRCMENIDDNEPSNLIFSKDFETKFHYFNKFGDEIFCIKKLLKSLDNILIISDEEDLLISSNRRRHIICQISTVYTSLLQQIIQSNPSINTIIEISKEISSFTSQIIKYLQTNFVRNCEDFPRADRDQQLGIKLFLDISYSTVPQLQLFY